MLLNCRRFYFVSLFVGFSETCWRYDNHLVFGMAQVLCSTKWNNRSHTRTAIIYQWGRLMGGNIIFG
jgi:hypothetical protein